MNQEHIDATTIGATVLFGLTASEIGAYCAILQGSVT